MDIKPYNIAYWQGDNLKSAGVKPCCREDNVVDYAIYSNNRLLFTITKSNMDKAKWLVSLKNADKEIEEEVIQNIGMEIDRRNNNE